METSTPLAGPSRGTGRVIKDMQNVGTRIFNESNDDIERVQRRKSAALRRSIISLPPATNTSSNQNDSMSLLSYEDLKTQLQIFCKLNSDNKINVRNAWNLRVIDVLQQMVSKSDNLEILKIAANSLEIAGKVYGLRVDDLHAEGFKLASSLARNFASLAQEGEESDENQDPSAAHDEIRPKKKQQKKKRLFSTDKKHTINDDPKAFMKPLPKLESAAFSARTDTTLSVTGNLFTNRIRMDPAGYKFMFASNEKSWAWIPGNDPSVKTNKKHPFQVPSIESHKLCSAFKDFRMDNWEPGQENQLLERNSNVLEDVVLDDEGIPIAELDGSMHDVFVERNDDESMDQDVEHIVDFRPTEQGLAHSMERSAYSFNSVRNTCSGKIDQIWAGPSHWKLKFIRRQEMVYSGQDRHELDKIKKRARKEKNQPTRLNLWNLKTPNNLRQYPKKPRTKKKKNCIVDANKVTMPLLESSCLMMLENIEYLMTVPTMKPVKKRRTLAEVNYPLTEYNYNNPNDSNYCPEQLANHDNEADLGDDNQDNNLSTTLKEDNLDYIGNNLVDAPEMVHKTSILYATKAKQIDMKKLKNAVWCTLTRKDEFDPSAMVIPISFQELYKQLPKLLSEKMVVDLTSPIAFVALLHLCNEQSLALQSRDLSDFDIIGPAF